MNPAASGHKQHGLLLLLPFAQGDDPDIVRTPAGLTDEKTAEPEMALEQSWLLAELHERFGLSLEELARRFSH